MGRRTRIVFPGAVFHATSHSIDEKDLFTCDEERRLFIRIQDEEIAKGRARRLSHCLMGNHFHLALRTETVPLGEIMQRILFRYSLAFNRRHERRGHLFRDRYYPVLCKDDAQLAVMIRYIHMNPVKAGLVADPRDWPWSSLRELEASGIDGLLPGSRDTEAFLAAVEAYDPYAVAPEPLPALALLRSEPGAAFDFEAAIGKVAEATGFSRVELLSRSKLRPLVSARLALIRQAARGGMRPASIARALGISPTIVSRALVRKANVENVQNVHAWHQSVGSGAK